MLYCAGFILEIGRRGSPSVILGGPFPRKGNQKNVTEKAWTQVTTESRMIMAVVACKW